MIRLFGKEFARCGIIKCAESGDSTERIGMKWVIGNGRILNLLKDSWWMGKTLDKAIAAVPQEDLSRCMAYFVDENGCWKWDKFQHLLPVASCLKIAGIKPPSILFFRRLVNKPNPVDSGYATSHRKLG